MLNFDGEDKQIGTFKDPDTNLFFGVLGNGQGEALDLTSLGYKTEGIALNSIQTLVLLALEAQPSGLTDQ